MGVQNASEALQVESLKREALYNASDRTESFTY